MEILHTGDTHIGYRQYGSDERRRDFLEAFERVARDAIEDDVDVLVHAGDLFHSRNPRLEDVIPTIELFRELRDAGVEVLAVVGNHERKRHDQWLDLLERIDAVTRLGREPVEVGDAAFYGVDYVPPSQIEGFDYDFASTDASHAFLVLHGRFEPFPYGEWPLERFVERTDVDWDRFLLGDYHHPVQETVAGVPAAYCGSTERVSTEERESRGYELLTVEDDNVQRSRRAIPTRDFVFVEVDVADGDGDATGDVIARTEEYEVADSVVIVEVDGAPEPTVVQSEVEAAVADRGATVVRVNDRRDEREADDDRVEVSFVDPDDAVRERIASMRLSDAGRLVDDLVRGDRVPDSNVADEVEREVRELAEDGDGVFERPDEPEEPAGSDTAAAPEADDGGEAERDDEAEEPDAGPETAEDAGDAVADAGDDAGDDEGAGDEAAGDGEPTVSESPPGDERAEAEEPDDEAMEGDDEGDDVTEGETEDEAEPEPEPEVAGQSSMEDWA